MELELAGNSHMSSLGDALIGCHDEVDDTVVGLFLAICEKSGCFGGCMNILFVAAVEKSGELILVLFARCSDQSLTSSRRW
jgi:hypothetical protein